MTLEKKWACGCHEVDGQLVAECTQARPAGEVSAEAHGTSKPFSPRCFRLAPAAEVPAGAEPILVPVADTDDDPTHDWDEAGDTHEPAPEETAEPKRVSRKK